MRKTILTLLTALCLLTPALAACSSTGGTAGVTDEINRAEGETDRSISKSDSPTGWTDSITYTLGPVLDPLVNTRKVITLYPDGRGEMTEYDAYDTGQSSLPAYPVGEGPVQNVYTFNIATEDYQAIEAALRAADFFSLDEDLGVNETDTAYHYVTVEAGGETHTVGAAGWPRVMEEVMAAITVSQQNAYFEEENPGARIIWAKVFYGDGVASVFEYTLDSGGQAGSALYDEVPIPAPESFGRESYEGETPDSEYTRYLEAGSFDALLQVIEQSGFYEMPELLWSEGDAGEIDWAREYELNIVTVIRGEEEHTVRMAGYAWNYPDEFTAVLDAIDEAYHTYGEEPLSPQEIFQFSF